jgi:non-structural maintenance of chromosomes element 4
VWRTATEKFSFPDIRSIDSRFLVKAAVLASRKAKNAALGDGSQDVDVDDFISKCISFLRKGDEALLESNPARSSRPATQSQRLRRTQLDSDGEDDEANDGDTHNWAWLGSRACFAVTKRPCLPGFLLGPLSVQKRIRAVTQRRARQERLDPNQSVRPRELDVADFQQQDKTGVTQMCKTINPTLNKLLNEVYAAEEAEDE